MDKTPKAKSLRFVKQSSNKKDDTSLPVPKTNNDYTSTPIKGAKKPRRWENESCSQDSGEIDVTWDWDSPKNIKPKILRTKKKEIFTSPKVTLKKSSQIDHIKNFEKLREELQLLRDEIARVDDDCLPLSPVDEQKLKRKVLLSVMISILS
ncbi:hypothetical protein HHI36_002266 [Cryptolaemus montrouzieri]|uniref:Uncharacterized protein n=1 Tax=Cryptolaemus montrouzieri TaxID=559131 RepID=A0ABD2PA38_9CUCU